MRVYFTATDNGDGSNGVEFFDNPDIIARLEDENPETYRGEGGGWFEVPDGTTITGITIKSTVDND